jgi:murein DD-endopeptidase MepM/ murein hydrolase activator NlpD
MYMGSGSDAISLLTGSVSFYDVLVRAEMLRNINERNAEFTDDLMNAIRRQEEAIGELKTDRQLLETDKFILEEQQKVYENEFAQLQAERAAVSAEANKRYNELYALTAQRDELQSRVRGIRGEVESGNAEIERTRKRIAELEEENRRIASFIASQQNANSDRPNHSANGFIWPVDARFSNITCHFGFDPWRNGMHSGIDIASGGINGASTFAIQAGTVIRANDGGGWNGGYGNLVIIDHGGGYSSLYAHLQTGSVSVSVGQEVKQGQQIGRVGSTGWSTGPHLHFEIRRNGTAVNPSNYVRP